MKTIVFNKIFPCLAIIFVSLCEVFQGQLFVVLCFLLVLPYTITQLKSRRLKKNGTYVRAFLFLSLLGGLINMPLTGYGIGGLLLTIAMVGLAVFCVNNPKICLYISLFLLLYTLGFLYKSIFVNNIELNSIYESLGFSKNYPGFLIVAYTVFYGFNKYRLYKRLPLLLPLVGVYFTYCLDGRSSFGIMILFSIFCIFKNTGNTKINCLILLLLVSVCLYFSDYLLGYYEMSRLSEGMESSRSSIWSAYFKYMDFSGFLLGCDSAHFPIIKQYAGNPHNSFLNFHHRMGIIGFTTLLYVSFASMKKYITQKRWIIMVLMLFLMARLFFDSCIVSNHDYIFYTFLFLPFWVKNKRVILFSDKTKMPQILKLL